MEITVVKQLKSDGSFGGNQTQTRQEINMPSTMAMDNFYNKPGATTLPEAILRENTDQSASPTPVPKPQA